MVFVCSRYDDDDHTKLESEKQKLFRIRRYFRLIYY